MKLNSRGNNGGSNTAICQITPEEQRPDQRRSTHRTPTEILDEEQIAMDVIDQMAIDLNLQSPNQSKNSTQKPRSSKIK